MLSTWLEENIAYIWIKLREHFGESKIILELPESRPAPPSQTKFGDNL